MRKFLIWSVLLAGIAGVAYLATVGCFHMLGRKPAAMSWVDHFNLPPERQEQVEEARKQFMAQKQESCQRLCAKRAQIIQLLKQTDPDRSALMQLTEEVGQEQTLLEKATLEYLLAVNRHLDPAQRERLSASLSEELRTACKATACGMTPGCAVMGE